MAVTFGGGRPVEARRQTLQVAPKRNVRHQDVRSAEQRVPNPPRVLVVQEALPPVARDVLGQEYDDDVLVDPLGRVFQVSDQWANQLAVWRLNDDERDARQLLGKSAVEVLSCLDVVG